MVIGVLDGRHLPDAAMEAWSQLQLSEPTLASPFFRPEFTRIVAECRRDVRVAVLEGGGFFPFQRATMGIGLPVGSRLSDYQGLVAPPEAEINVRELLRACGLATWEFDGLLAAQRSFTPFQRVRRSSPVIDLSDGYAAYLAERHDAGSAQLGDAAKQAKRLSRRVGELRFEAHVTDAGLFDQLLDWKSVQYARTGAVDVFGFPWVREVVRRVYEASDDAFAGLLSVLYADAEPVAMHLGLRSASVWHSWFPAYDPRYASYSPGVILLARMAEAAPALGVAAIDLGKGDALYKRRFANAEVELVSGIARRTSIAAIATSLEGASIRVLRRTPLRRIAQRATTRWRLT